MTPRNYTAERLRESKARKEARKTRGRARYSAIKAGKVKVGDGKVVGHTKGGAKGSTRIETQKASNRQGGRMAPRSAKVRGGKNSTRDTSRATRGR